VFRSRVMGLTNKDTAKGLAMVAFGLESPFAAGAAVRSIRSNSLLTAPNRAAWSGLTWNQVGEPNGVLDLPAPKRAPVLGLKLHLVAPRGCDGQGNVDPDADYVNGTVSWLGPTSLVGLVISSGHPVSLRLGLLRQERAPTPQRSGAWRKVGSAWETRAEIRPLISGCRAARRLPDGTAVGWKKLGVRPDECSKICRCCFKQSAFTLTGMESPRTLKAAGRNVAEWLLTKR
jgi:hypothetical protein